MDQSDYCRATRPRTRHTYGGSKALPRACPLETHSYFVWRWRGEGWAHVTSSWAPGGVGHLASHQPPVDSCPYNRCPSFLTARVAVGPGGSRGKRARLLAAAKGPLLQLQHHPRAIWCPRVLERSGMQAERKTAVTIALSPSLLHTAHPG